MKKRKEINYLTSNTGTSEFLNSLSETEPICVSETSFSSNDISIGSIYKVLGFKKIYDDNISYWYIDNKFVRHHRFKYRKSELIKLGFDKTMSESQIIRKMNLNKIYDSGQTKWLWENGL